MSFRTCELCGGTGEQENVFYRHLEIRAFQEVLADLRRGAVTEKRYKTNRSSSR